MLRFYQHRILIDGIPCVVMATSRVSRLSDIIFVRRPAGSWATFIIYVVKDPISDRNNFFIVLASEAAETTTRSINLALLASYESAWDLLGSSSIHNKQVTCRRQDP